MSTPRLLSGSLFDLSRAPQADVVTITPLIPTDVEDVTGLGVLDDGLLVGDPVTIAANSQGEWASLVIPTSQTRAGPSGVGVRYRVAVSAAEFVEIEMADADSRLVSLIGGSVPGAQRDARGVVYAESKDVIVAGTNVTLDDDDTARTITINAAGGGSGGGGDVTTAQLNAVDARVTTNADNISTLAQRVTADEGGLQTEASHRTEGDDVQSVTISTASSYQATLNSQTTSRQPLLLVVDTAISGTRGGAAYSHDAGDVFYLAPLSDDLEFLFNIESEGVDLSVYRTSADQDIIDNRHTQGILLARQEARAADGKAVAAQDAIPERVPDAPTAAGRYELSVPSSGSTSWATATSGGGGGDVTAAQLAAETTARTNADTALGTRIDTLTYEVEAVSHWVRGAEARTLQFALRWATAVARGVSVTFSIGGTPATVTTAEGYAAGERFILAVPITAGNAGTINRESSTAAGYVAVTASIGGTTARTYMQTEQAPGGSTAAGTARSTVLRAPTSAASTDTTITLPTDYATYQWLNIVLEDAPNDESASATIPMAFLATKTQENTIIRGIFGLSASTAESVLWTANNRQVRATGGTIAYAVIFDGGPRGLPGAAATPTAPTKQLMATGQTLPLGTYELNTLGHRDVSGRRFFYSHTLPIEALDVGRASRIYLGEANPASPRDGNDVYVELALSSDRTLTFASGGIAGWTIRLYAVRA